MVQLDIDRNYASDNGCEVFRECNEYNVMQFEVKRKYVTSCIHSGPGCVLFKFVDFHNYLKMPEKVICISSAAITPKWGKV